MLRVLYRPFIYALDESAKHSAFTVSRCCCKKNLESKRKVEVENTINTEISSRHYLCLFVSIGSYTIACKWDIASTNVSPKLVKFAVKQIWCFFCFLIVYLLWYTQPTTWETSEASYLNCSSTLCKYFQIESDTRSLGSIVVIVRTPHFMSDTLIYSYLVYKFTEVVNI